MKTNNFTKMSGAGNDFVLIDKKINPKFEATPNNIKKLCARRTGIGADGLLIIEDNPTHSFSMNYFNSDGSTGTLCGNGARCAIKYANVSGRIKNEKSKFLCHDVEYTCQVFETGDVQFHLNDPEEYKSLIKLDVFSCKIDASFIDTGSPHVVIRVEDIHNCDEKTRLNNLDVHKIGAYIRHHNEFAPGGTNVNFIDIVGNNLYIRTFERGVEEETLACGTGSVAAAVIGAKKYGLLPPVDVITRSGAKIIVNFNLRGEEVSEVSMIGPAEIIYNGEFNI
ncbi:MAG: diaminopimelate epimerase [Melioribacteraceae bacterium]|nr:diaminopimelate epimerase [Melioribacteraceae bacterium]